MVRTKGTASPLGDHIRKHVIPKGMSVTTAAKKLRIDRPALSNLLNGNAALSPEMAMRLEMTFGADRQDLLDRQERQDKEQRREAERTVPVSHYEEGQQGLCGAHQGRCA